MRIIGFSIVCSLLAASANAFDMTNDDNWALSGIMPVTHSLAEASEKDALLVLPAHSFHTLNAHEESFEPATVITSATLNAGNIAKRPGAETVRQNQASMFQHASLTSDGAAKLYSENRLPESKMEQIIDAKWRAAEDFYVADFFKAHQ